MTRVYNRESQKQTRRTLRKEAPKAERLVWSRLRAAQAEDLKFRRQYGVGPYVVDFYCAKVKLAIELDGESHLDEAAEARDAKRQSYIESFGIRFLRFGNADVYDRVEHVREEIWHAANERVAEVRGNNQKEDPPQSPLGKGGGRIQFLDDPLLRSTT